MEGCGLLLSSVGDCHIFLSGFDHSAAPDTASHFLPGTSSSYLSYLKIFCTIFKTTLRSPIPKSLLLSSSLTAAHPPSSPSILSYMLQDHSSEFVHPRLLKLLQV